ncbi:MAG: efflux RND transporter periplasmic adaptor subunit [Verrucomicrobiae bacterium]|nr:efflux RND transporter periplasmic adaptor subunit [Verrucomicrobiae bacterium]
MNPPSTSKVARLRIDPAAKRRSQGSFWLLFGTVAFLAVAAVLTWQPWTTESDRVVTGRGSTQSRTSASSRDPAAPASSPTSPSARSAGTRSDRSSTPPPVSPDPARSPGGTSDTVVLTVSGYIINRERIELSPRFMGQVRWIGVTKGDAVTNGQVVVQLDDTEYQAQRLEVLGRLDGAHVRIERAQLELRRIERLAAANIETQQALDFARLDVAAARADLKSLEGQLARIDTWIDWTVIRSPINGVVLEKMVDPNELVTPQSFGGTRGPSTALISVGDPTDLQVEIDLNEADLSKVRLGQFCRVSPEAWLDRVYDGEVVEIAPEASRQKGTLQIKVQIRDPDAFLIPELSAKVDFLAIDPAPARGVAN